jgi:hypothetical protein
MLQCVLCCGRTVYEVIAKRIIDAAMNGERDPVQLRNIG